MTDDQLQRYARHVMLDEIGVDGQQRLLDSHALVVGAGGLGSPVALYLGSAGVGELTIVDDDTVDLTNLQRQVAHDASRIGLPKAASAARSVLAIDPAVRVNAVQRRADAALLDDRLPRVDVVVDCCDNFATRHAVNAACVRHRVPLVSGAAVGWDAQVSVYDTRRDDAPCYACVFPPDAAHEDVACALLGVFAPLVGIVGSLQAAEALKLLVGTGTGLAGRLAMFDARSGQWQSVDVARDPHCPVCAARPATAPRLSSRQ